MLHRDIKPGNILVDRYGTPKLADFGLAALLDAQGGSTVTRDALSPSYAPPEAFAMAEPTPQADVYSLAATLYTLLAGKPPRPVPWPITIFDHLGEVLRRPVPTVNGVPQALHDTIARALHPDTNAAHGDGGAAAGRVARASPSSHNHRAPRKKWPLVAAGLVVAVTAGVLVWNFGGNKTQASGDGPNKTNTAPQEAPPFLKVCDSGYCIDKSTCFAGINHSGGQAATARKRASCADEHFWEAFAGGWLSGDIPKADPDDLVKSPELAKTCTPAVMKANTRPGVDTTGWEITAVGFKEGDRNYYLCFGKNPEIGEDVTSAFGPQ